MVRDIENVWIPLSDGCKLAARIWLPEDALANPVPAILEYIPYRKRDFTRRRDESMHAWFAMHGYGAIRVDMRGSGDSDGILHDEYLRQEQDDAIEVRPREIDDLVDVQMTQPDEDAKLPHEQERQPDHVARPEVRQVIEEGG